MQIKTRLSYKLFLVILLLVHLSLLLNTRFTAWPEMLTYPWLIMHGYRFYGDIIHPYLPLLPYALVVVFSLVGLSVLSLQVFALVVLFFTDILIYKIAFILGGRKHALFSLLLFILSHIFFEGNTLWFDLASIPLVLLAVYFLVGQKKTSPKEIFIVGVALGLAILTKQTNILYLCVVLIFSFFKGKSFIPMLIVGSLIPLLAVTSYFVAHAEGGSFFYWGIWYPIFMLPHMPGFQLMPSVIQLVIILFWFSPVIFFWKKSPFITCLFFMSLVFAFPRFAYFHLQHATVFMSLILPFGLMSFSRNKLKPLLIVYFLGISILFYKFVVHEWNRPVRFFEPEALSARQVLFEKFPKPTSAFFLNVPANYFVGTSLFPVKPWVDTFPWYLELPHMQEQLVQKMQATDVVLLTPFNRGQQYELGVYEPKKIVTYFKENFSFQEKIGTIRIEIHKRIQ